MKTLSIFLFCCFLTVMSKAQSISKVKINELMHMIDTSSAPTVFNFWASWCGPCVREIPWFEKQVAAFKSKGVRMVLVSLDFPDAYPKAIEAFAKKNHYRSSIIWLDEPNADVFCPMIDKSWEGTIPVTLMVNNRKHYRQFFNQQLPEERLVLELKKLTE